ncbi:unnamed protein product [Alternaria alternata]
MPILSQEDTNELDAGSTGQTSNASCQTPAAQQTYQRAIPRNPVNPNPPSSQNVQQTSTQRTPVKSNNDISVNAPAPYPFGPDQIVGHPTGLQFPRDRADAVKVLVRLLLDILVYSYDVDFHELHFALAASSPHLCTANLSTRNTSLLNFQEMRVVLEYADAIHKVCEAVIDNTQSLLKDEDRNVIIDLIMQPAQTLGIDVAYVFEQLPGWEPAFEHKDPSRLEDEYATQIRNRRATQSEVRQPVLSWDGQSAEYGTAWEQS